MSKAERVENLKTMIAQNDKNWGSYDAKGNAAVDRAVMFAANKILEQAKAEVEGAEQFSLATRISAVESATNKFRKACKNYPDSGLMDTDVREQVYFFLESLLTVSGVDETFANYAVRSIKYGGF